MPPTEGERVTRLCEVIEGNREEATRENENGLPGIFLSARMGLGDISLVIDVQRRPTGRELSSFAWHFRNFAEQKGYSYEVMEGATPRLNKRLQTGDTLCAYVVQTVDRGNKAVVDLAKQYGTDLNILREYLQAINPQS